MVHFGALWHCASMPCMCALATPTGAYSCCRGVSGVARSVWHQSISRCGLRWLLLMQVERESHVRQVLGDGACPGLPRTIFLGHLELGQQEQETELAGGGHTQRHALHGAAVVVTELCGEPLLARGAQVYPRLAAAEVERLVCQLMVPLLVLQVGMAIGACACPSRRCKVLGPHGTHATDTCGISA